MEIYGITDLFLDCRLESLILVSYDRNVRFIDTWMNLSDELPKRLPSEEIFITEDDDKSNWKHIRIRRYSVAGVQCVFLEIQVTCIGHKKTPQLRHSSLRKRRSEKNSIEEFHI